MTNQIVTINVSQKVAPAPATLQQTGALISQGATTQSAGSWAILTQASDLTPLLTGGKAITSATWATGTVTITTTVPHGFTLADTLLLTIAGVMVSGSVANGYNGTFTVTVTGVSTFTYAVASNPGTAVTTSAIYTPEDVAELVEQVTTFFGVGSNASIYVLELGVGNAADGVTALSAWITANPGVFYLYVVPRFWDADASFLAFLATFESVTAKTYFLVTTTTGTYTSYTALMKDVLALVEAPAVAAVDAVLPVEFSIAAVAYVILNRNPSGVSKVPPLGFSFLPGTTPYPTKGNSALLATLKAAGINYVGTGAEGYINNAILFWGTTADKKKFNYWYATDWAQINLKLDLSNAIINGSNNTLAPLYYNQPGINSLQAVAQATLNRGTEYGLLLGQATVTAVPFATYVSNNPSDYDDGVYNGLAATITPQNGFTSITFNLNVTNFPLGS